MQITGSRHKIFGDDETRDCRLPRPWPSRPLPPASPKKQTRLHQQQRRDQMKMGSIQDEIRQLRAENMMLHDDIKALRKDVTSLKDLLGMLISRVGVTAIEAKHDDEVIIGRDEHGEDSSEGNTQECSYEIDLKNGDMKEVVLEEDGSFTADNSNVTGTPPRNLGYRSRIRSQMKREITSVVSKEDDGDGLSGSDLVTNDSRTLHNRVGREIKRIREAAFQTVPNSMSL